jgi:uncharacterized protein (DUF302 family)
MAAKTNSDYLGQPSYGFTRVLEGVSYGDAVEMVKGALAEEGFGVLTEIDVKATLKKKLDADFRNYIILGACNPPLAHRALSGEAAIGLLLPCNVVVTEEDGGNAIVSAASPEELFSLVKNPELQSVAKDVGVRIQRALDSLG